MFDLFYSASDDPVGYIGGGGAGPATPSGVPTALPASYFPNTDDGLPITQINLHDNIYWTDDYPLLNLLKSGGWTAKDSANADVMSYSEMLANGYVDPVTGDPTGIPPGATKLQSTIFRERAPYRPSWSAGTYRLRWDGQGYCQLWLNGTAIEANRTPNSVDFVFPASNTAHDAIVITSIGPGFGNVRLYRAEFETNIETNGEVFDPNYLNLASAFKVIRPMDWNHANSSSAVDPDEIPQKSWFVWRPISIEAQFDLAMITNTALWINVPGFLGQAADIKNNLSTWQPNNLQPYGYDHWDAPLYSDAMKRYCDRLAAAVIASGYPRNRCLYVELDNENWNIYFKHASYFSGIGKAMNGQARPATSDGAGMPPAMTAGGYYSAFLMTQLQAAFEEAGIADQVWIMVMGTQMGYVPASYPADVKMQSFLKYFTDRGIDPTPWKQRCGLSGATYFYEVISELRGLYQGTAAERDSAWLAAIANPTQLKTDMKNWYLNTPASAGGQTIPQIIARRQEIIDYAAANGYLYIGEYEGGWHETVGSSTLTNDAGFKSFWFDDWRKSQEFQDVHTALYTQLRAQKSDAMLSHYLSYGMEDFGAPWFFTAYWGETGPVKSALAPFLRHSI